MGIKVANEEKLKNSEDTSTAYIRMILNKVFNIREQLNFRKRELYLTALFNSVSSDGPIAAEKPKMVRRLALPMNPERMRIVNPKMNVPPALVRVTETDGEKINLRGVIQYERDLRNKTFRKFMKTAKQIDSIFMRSFSYFNTKNLKSFRWSVFSIYSRKPGVDLSIIINGVLLVFLAYNLIFISTILGKPTSFIQQFNSSVIRVEVVVTLLGCIFLLIIERIIYKRNPTEWRKNFSLDKNESRKPQDLTEIRKAIKLKLKDKIAQHAITWEILELKDEVTEKQLKF